MWHWNAGILPPTKRAVNPEDFTWVEGSIGLKFIF